MQDDLVVQISVNVNQDFFGKNDDLLFKGIGFQVIIKGFNLAYVSFDMVIKDLLIVLVLVDLSKRFLVVEEHEVNYNVGKKIFDEV